MYVITSVMNIDKSRNLYQVRAYRFFQYKESLFAITENFSDPMAYMVIHLASGRPVLHALEHLEDAYYHFLKNATSIKDWPFLHFKGAVPEFQRNLRSAGYIKYSENFPVLIKTAFRRSLKLVAIDYYRPDSAMTALELDQLVNQLYVLDWVRYSPFEMINYIVDALAISKKSVGDEKVSKLIEEVRDFERSFTVLHRGDEGGF